MKKKPADTLKESQRARIEKKMNAKKNRLKKNKKGKKKLLSFSPSRRQRRRLPTSDPTPGRDREEPPDPVRHGHRQGTTDQNPQRPFPFWGAPQSGTRRAQRRQRRQRRKDQRQQPRPLGRDERRREQRHGGADRERRRRRERGLQRVAHVVEVDPELVARVRPDDVALGQFFGDGQCEVFRDAARLVDLGELGELVRSRGGALLLLPSLLFDVGLRDVFVAKKEKKRRGV